MKSQDIQISLRCYSYHFIFVFFAVYLFLILSKTENSIFFRYFLYPPYPISFLHSSTSYHIQFSENNIFLLFLLIEFFTSWTDLSVINYMQDDVQSTNFCDYLMPLIVNQSLLNYLNKTFPFLLFTLFECLTNKPYLLKPVIWTIYIYFLGYTEEGLVDPGLII